MKEIPGWLTPDVGAAMRNLIWKTKPEVCVEIGVFAGKSLINTALALKENGHGIVYGIDPWRLDVALAGASPDEFDWNKADLDAVHYDCMRAIWEHGLDRYAIVVRSDAYNARVMFRCGDINILYVDGGHSEESSSKDVSFYLPLVAKCGHIWMDDTNYASLSKAIGIVEQQCQLVKDFGHARLYKKL